MSRLVRIPRSAETDPGTTGFENVRPAGLAGPGREPIADSYLERIAKYIPGEVLAFFIVINAILNQAALTGGRGAMMAGIPVMTIAQGVLAVCVILTPLFVWYVHEKGDAWVINACVSTLAFPFWAYALGATVFREHWDGNLAAIMLAIVTALSGLIAPRARTSQGAQVAAPAPPRTVRPQLDLVGPGPA
jgi:hypothetical protein